MRSKRKGHGFRAAKQQRNCQNPSAQAVGAVVRVSYEAQAVGAVVRVSYEAQAVGAVVRVSYEAARSARARFARVLQQWFVIAGMLLGGILPAPAQFARPAIARGVNLEQKLNAPVPLDLVFRDESGQAVPLRTYFGDKPVVLEMVYFTCPSLCPMSMHESVVALRRLSKVPGLDYNVVIVSFDPNDTPAMAAQKKASYEKEFNRAGFNSGFHFLTGNQDSVSKLASAIGFGYRYDAGTKQFVHAAGIMVATPAGRMSRYFYGVDYSPTDLRMALNDAAQHKISSPVDYVLQFCFHYDASQGKYTLAILNVLKLAGGVTVFLLAGLIFFLMRHKRTPQQPKSSQAKAWKEARHVG